MWAPSDSVPADRHSDSRVWQLANAYSPTRRRLSGRDTYASDPAP